MFEPAAKTRLHLRRQISAVEENFEEDLEASGAESVYHRLDEGLPEDALPVGVADLHREVTVSKKVQDDICHSHCLTILEYFVSLNRYASDSGLSSEMENSSEMTRIEPSTEIKSEWTKRSERDEMKARMITPPPSPFFYASTRLGGIHRGLFVEGREEMGFEISPFVFHSFLH